jgi:hypothetical protein
MRNTRILFAASLFAGASVALAAGCGSSKSGGSTPVVEAGPSDDGAAEASGVLGSGCSPISLGGGAAVLCDPGMDLTCCVDLSGGITSLLSAFTGSGMLGSCVSTASCMGGINVQCEAPSDCTTGQSCCGSTTGDAGALAAEFAEAGLGDAGFSLDGSSDATPAINEDAAAAALSSISFVSTCATSCTSAQYTLCSTNSDCKANPGYVCGAPPLAALGGGASFMGFSLSSAISFMVCQPPDAGTTTPPAEAGTTESDAGKSDAASEAGSTTTESDASTDAATGATDAPTGG